MARLVSAIYDVETFQHFQEQRQRPKMVFAVLGPKSHTGQRNISTLNYTSRAGTQSLARYSPAHNEYDDRATDYFLSSFDDGHLIGDQLGGSREPYNLVPQAAEQNRGGAWKTVEAEAAKASYCLYMVVCKYKEYSTDPRIPSKMYGMSIQLGRASYEKLVKDMKNVFDRYIVPMTRNSMSQIGQAIRTSLHTNKCLSDEDLKWVREATIQQQGLHIRPPVWTVDTNTLITRLHDAWTNMDPDWQIEQDDRFLLSETGGGLQYRFEYELPPPDYRPYRVLDYLAIRNELNDLVLDPGTNNPVVFNVNQMYGTATFSQAATSLIMVTNRILHHHALKDRGDLYYSDAPDDAFSLGERLVTNPEIDHIVPATPPNAARRRGPSVFSNARLVSNVYNNNKSNQTMFSLQQTVAIGTAIPIFLQQAVRANRGTNKRRQNDAFFKYPPNKRQKK